MCSTVKDERTVFALKSINRYQNEYDGANGLSQQSPIARLFSRDSGFEYLMRKSRVTVGRTSAKRGSADVDMGNSTFISRNHLEIYTTEARFYVLVTGKNGVFVDDYFHRKGGSAFELPRTCLLRFPSTDIKIQFEMLMEDNPYIESKRLSPSPVNETSVSPPRPLSYKLNSLCDMYNSTTQSGGCESLYPVKEEIVPHVVEMSETPENDVGTEPLTRASSPVEESAADAPTEASRSKPPYSYAQLIIQAITSQKDQQLTLSGIYNYITKKYPFYRNGDKGWQNSIRHNLSLNRYFVKVPRAQEEAGKGCFWRIDPNSAVALTDHAFRRRRQRPTPYCKTNGSGEMPAIQPMANAAEPFTPDDSCASWEAMGSEEVNQINAEYLQQSEQGPRLQALDGKIPQISYSSVQFGGANLYMPLPSILSKPQFFIAKPSYGPGAVLRDPNEAASLETETASSISSNEMTSCSALKTFVEENMKSYVMPVLSDGVSPNDCINSFQVLQQPLQMNSQPKTIFLRSNTSTSLPTPLSFPGFPTTYGSQLGNQLIRLAYGSTLLPNENIVLPGAGNEFESSQFKKEEMKVEMRNEGESNFVQENQMKMESGAIEDYKDDGNFSQRPNEPVHFKTEPIKSEGNLSCNVPTAMMFDNLHMNCERSATQTACN